MKILKFRKCAPEKDEQQSFANWLRCRGYVFCYVPNDMLINNFRGGVNYGWLSSMIKRGFVKGFPEYLIFGDRHGRQLNLAIEMKRKIGGRVSPSQKQEMTRLRSVGWTTVVAHGFLEAIWIVESVEKAA
jgi:hypothetical protein